MPSSRLRLLALGLLALALAAGPRAAAQAPLTLYVAVDGDDSRDCRSAATACKTLAAAIAKASAGSTINLAAGQHPGNVVIDRSLTIVGAGAAGTVLYNASGGRVAEVRPGATVTIRALNIAGGATLRGAGLLNGGALTLEDSLVSGNRGAEGAGIANDGTLTLRRTTLRDNGNGQPSANLGDDGGGVLNAGTLSVVDSSFEQNRLGRGGAIYNEGALSVSGSSFVGNQATASGGFFVAGEGGAIYSAEGATASISGSRFEANQSQGGGGAIYSEGSLELRYSALISNTAGLLDGGGGGVQARGRLLIEASTISDNRTADDDTQLSFRGGGVRYDGAAGQGELNGVTVTGNAAGIGGGLYGPLTIRNTIVAGNGAPGGGPDCAAGVGSGGHNLIGDGSGCGLAARAGDRIGTAAAPLDPQLGPLADNGGGTPSRLPAAASPAVDAGDPASCPGLDQRGLARAGRCDIGAVERDGRAFTPSERLYLPYLSGS